MINNISKEKEKALLKSKTIIRRIKFFSIWLWIFPHLLESYLEKMAKEGYFLYKISKLQVLYFIKGDSKPVKCAVDYNHKIDDNYFEHHKDCGWELMYTPLIKKSGFVVWARQYNSGEAVPKFYSDSESKSLVSKRVLIPYLICETAILILGFIAMIIFRNNSTAFSTISSFVSAMFFIFIISTLPLFILDTKKNRNLTISKQKRSTAKKVLLLNLILFVLFLVALIIISTITATTTIVDGVKTTDFTSDNSFLDFIRIGAMLYTILSFLAFFFTIPYAIVISRKK